MALPTNVDSTYADSGTDASVALHQQHHDTIHAVTNYVAGASGYPVSPARQGFVGWTFDPGLSALATFTPVSGRLYLMAVSVPMDITVSNVTIDFAGAAGTGYTSGQNFVGLYSSAGTRLAQSADQSTAWATNGFKTAALTSSASITGGQSTYVWVAVLVNASSPGPLFHSSLLTGAAGALLQGITASTARMAHINSQTSLPSSFTPSSLLTSSPAYLWVALS
jgi:hypothetical protein